MQVYLDNSATTKLDPRVLKKMMPYLTDKYGNASSIHKMGDEASLAIQNSINKIAKILNCNPANLIFTSGATESNNLIIKGVARANKSPRDTILISEFEHAATIAPAKQLEKEGFKLKIIPILPNGQIDLNALKSLLNNKVLLVSVMTVNNEIGAIQPIDKIAQLAHSSGALFHTDAVQAVPYLKIDIRKSKVDFLSLSAHKFHGPKGMGLAYIDRKHAIEPIIDGGEQQYGIRSGTFNVPGIVGMAEALFLAYKERDKHVKHIKTLRDYMLNQMQKQIEDIHLNGSLNNRTPNNLNIRFENIEGEAIVMDLSDKGICAGTGSACSSKKLSSSHVLKSIGLKKEHLNSNVRFTPGKFTTKKEIDYTLSQLKKTVARLRDFSPIK